MGGGRRLKRGTSVCVYGNGLIETEVRTLITEISFSMILLDNIVDVGHGGADEECENECNDIMSACPDIHIDGIKHSEDGEAPSDTIDDNVLSCIKELVDDISEE